MTRRVMLSYQPSALMRRVVLFQFLLFAGLLVLSACHSTPATAHPPLAARLYLEARAGEEGVPVKLPVSGVEIAVGSKPVFTEYDLLNAEVARVELGPCLLLQFSPAAARDLYRLSVASLGRRLVLLVDGAPLGVHRIGQPLPDGNVLVFIERPDAELPGLVQRLKHTSADLAAAANKSR
jgi:hypothetical protein